MSNRNILPHPIPMGTGGGITRDLLRITKNKEDEIFNVIHSSRLSPELADKLLMLLQNAPKHEGTRRFVVGVCAAMNAKFGLARVEALQSGAGIVVPGSLPALRISDDDDITEKKRDGKEKGARTFWSRKTGTQREEQNQEYGQQ